MSTSPAVAHIRPLYPDSSKLPASTTVAYGRKWRCRGRLKLQGNVSMPGVMLRKRELSIVDDISIFQGRFMSSSCPRPLLAQPQSLHGPYRGLLKDQLPLQFNRVLLQVSRDEPCD